MTPARPELFFKTWSIFVAPMAGRSYYIGIGDVGASQRTGNGNMPSRPDRNNLYVARHYVRAFLRQYATPSICVELLEETSHDNTTDWFELVQSVHRELTGKRVKV